MKRAEQEPTVTNEGMSRVDGGKTYTHPAYGMISASHVSGTTTLFGTDFEHHNWVVVRVAPARLIREIMHDWHMADSRPYIEVAMSESQWATFVSRPNTGQGVPCTVEYADGEEMPSIPLRRSTDAHADDFKARVADLMGHVQKARAAITDELSGLSGKTRDAALAHIARLEQDLTANLPWYVEVLEKQMHKTVESAKVEVGAYINTAITRAGLAALNGDAPIKLLPNPED